MKINTSFYSRLGIVLLGASSLELFSSEFDESLDRLVKSNTLSSRCLIRASSERVSDIIVHDENGSLRMTNSNIKKYRWCQQGENWTARSDLLKPGKENFKTVSEMGSLLNGLYLYTTPNDDRVYSSSKDITGGLADGAYRSGLFAFLLPAQFSAVSNSPQFPSPQFYADGIENDTNWHLPDTLFHLTQFQMGLKNKKVEGSPFGPQGGRLVCDYGTGKVGSQRDAMVHVEVRAADGLIMSSRRNFVPSIQWIWSAISDYKEKTGKGLRRDDLPEFPKETLIERVEITWAFASDPEGERLYYPSIVLLTYRQQVDKGEYDSLLKSAGLTYDDVDKTWFIEVLRRKWGIGNLDVTSPLPQDELEECFSLVDVTGLPKPFSIDKNGAD